jgi:hypothetical protein
VDNASTLPSTAEWLLQATDGVFQFDRRPDGFLQIRVNRSVPGSMGDEEAVTLQLEAGMGLTAPVGLPARRRSDRPAGEPDRLLLVNLAGPSASETEAWARDAFITDVEAEPLGAVARLQRGAVYGGILIHTSRERIREAERACRAIRAMTGAALVVASDEPVRSTDRIDLLQAGADDCLSGSIDFRELSARIRQAVAVGGKAPPPLEVLEDDPPKPLGGVVSAEAFAREANRRAADQTDAVFSVIRVRGPAMPSELPRALGGEIRDEDGDLVSCSAGECMVLLQGARREPAKAFLARVWKRLPPGSGSPFQLDTEILVHPNDREGIRLLIGGSSAMDGEAPEPSGSGGPGGQEA